MIEALRQIISRVDAPGGRPITIALDGPSGAGKSTIARGLAAELPATLVQGDDFFAAELTRADWDARNAAERARDAIDWKRLRSSALEPLRAGRAALWHPFDFDAGERSDGSYPMALRPEQRTPAPIILLEGAYAARPELADLIDLSVLVHAPAAVRHARLAARESPEFLRAWHDRWDAAETDYFARVRPITSFDVVVDTLGGKVRDQR
jgi:uridine kinase